MPDSSSENLKRTMRQKRRKPSREEKKKRAIATPKMLPPAGLHRVKAPVRNKG